MVTKCTHIEIYFFLKHQNTSLYVFLRGDMYISCYTCIHLCNPCGSKYRIHVHCGTRTPHLDIYQCKNINLILLSLWLVVREWPFNTSRGLAHLVSGSKKITLLLPLERGKKIHFIHSNSIPFYENSLLWHLLKMFVCEAWTKFPSQ